MRRFEMHDLMKDILDSMREDCDKPIFKQKHPELYTYLLEIVEDNIKDYVEEQEVAQYLN